MNAKLLLRIAAIFMLLHAIGHSFGTFAEYVYFFPFAAIFTFLAGICPLLARIRIGMQE